MVTRKTFLSTVAALMFGTTAAFAQVTTVTPSTNDINRAKGWAHVDQLWIDKGTTTLEFISTRSFYSCFEYRTDGDTSQVIKENGGVNYNADITDGLYPYVCENNSSGTITLKAKSYLQVRMVFGAERDERFTWTTFYVGSVPKVTPWVYDPDDLGIASAAWVKEQGTSGSQALYLAKEGDTSANAAAGATLDGVAGTTLMELGLDYRSSDGYCGAGAPRFNVYTTNGTYYFFGCVYGAHDDNVPEDGWTRVRFTDASAYPADGITPFPGFGNAVITQIDIVFDEGPGSVYLDNIDVNGLLIEKAGKAKW